VYEIEINTPVSPLIATDWLSSKSYIQSPINGQMTPIIFQTVIYNKYYDMKRMSTIDSLICCYKTKGYVLIKHVAITSL